MFFNFSLNLVENCLTLHNTKGNMTRIKVIKQTHEEKVNMYRKVKKDEIIEMLINCNLIIENMPIRMVCGKCKKEIYDPIRFCNCKK